MYVMYYLILLQLYYSPEILITNFISTGEYIQILIFFDLQVHKYFSEALVLALTNPQYDDRFFIELPVQYMKIAGSEHVVYIHKLF